MTDASAKPGSAPAGRPLKRSSRVPLLVGTLALLSGSAALVWMYRQHGASPPPTPPPPPAAFSESATPPEPSGVAATADEKDVRRLLEATTPDPLLHRILAGGDLIRRWAVVTANVAVGESPRRELAAAAPATPFTVDRAGGRASIAPASYARYDAFADGVASIDARALATVYGAVHTALQTAYRALGYPYPSIDVATARALRRIENAPVREGPVLVNEDAGVYTFADSRLEDLGQVEKHLLRMGPRNTRLIQAKAREIAAALGLSVPRPAAEKR